MPDNKLLPGNLFKKAEENGYNLGDDFFMLVDLLLELKKNEDDADK